ncbi:YidB family protein [Bosea sp. CS1GBMeth4]|uniref:YidB family protein n=1 Tax=Bosea sp. CS1GBMeth4 TaxID=1892849 RepID=UPI001AECD51F|nr:YidB family protein [Bosea sp. CS1GBMeth4]
MGSDNGFPSMTALLGLLAIAGYQNRDKLAEWFGGAQHGERPLGAPAGIDGVLKDPNAAAGGGVGSLLGNGIQELLERFRQAGRGDAADSWVRTGANQQIDGQDLEQAIGPDVMERLAAQTGLSREEIVARLSRRLPEAIDKYTPDGQVPAA